MLRKRIFSVIAIRTTQLFIGIFMFLLGAFFIIFYNLRSGLWTIRIMWMSLIQPTWLGIDNWAYLDNLWLRTGQLFRMLKGDIEERWVWGVRELTFDYITPVVFGLALVFVLFFLFLRKDKVLFSKNKILFFYILYFTIFFVSPFTITHLQVGHLFILFPFFQIIMALFFCYLNSIFVKKKFVLSIIYIVFLASVFFNVRMILTYHQEMRRTGGNGKWSTAIYELADYLYENDISTPHAIDWGFHDNIAFLTNSKVIPVKLYKRHCWPPEELNMAYKKAYLSKREMSYIIAEQPVEKISFLKDIIKDYDKTIELIRIFYNRISEPIYYLYKIY